jgi:phospholipid/cholesterol/gamma-HCH transport system permease protein
MVKDTTERIALSPTKGLLKSFFYFFGGKTLRLNNDLGALGIFFFRSFFMIFRLKAIPDIVAQIYFIGAKSTQIVLLVGFFTGMVLGLQLYFVLVKFGSVGVLGTAIALTLIREMGPVLAAIMITARAGSAMTAEIGIQRISEQVDALSTMRIDPLGYLISPRIAAAIISFPILTAFFDLIGIIGAWFSGCVLLGVNSGTYFYRVVASTQMDDIMGGFYKSILINQ